MAQSLQQSYIANQMLLCSTCGHVRKPRLVGDEAHPLLQRIGNTPLLPLTRVTSHLNPNVKVYAKAEWFNPGGSVKDRAALNMILDGERSGQLTPDKIILDATSGNTGIAYAMIGALKGYKVKLAMPANASPERKKILQAYGAEIVLTDPMSGTDGAQQVVKKLYAENPDLYFYPDQYNNDANWLAHYKSTGPEIIEQTDGQLTHFVATLGTTGTFVGTTRYLKKHKPEAQVIAVQPDSPLHGLEGLKHLETAIVPGIYDDSLVDQHAEISTEAAFEMTKRLAREEGLFVGISAGAAVVSAIRVAESLDVGVVVTILCDGGSKYMNERFWDED